MEGFYRVKPYNTAQKNVHYAQVFGHGIQETFIQYVPLCGRNSGFIIRKLYFKVRFRCLIILESCTPFQ